MSRLRSVLRYLRAVAWSFFGIRRSDGGTADHQQLKPLPLIATAIVLALLFALLLLGLASSATAAVDVPDTLEQRAVACTGCHGKQGRSTSLGYVPRIAGKPAGYLAAQLRAFRDGQRQQDAMARLLIHLSDDYLAELAGYFATLKVDYPPPAPSRGTDATRSHGRRLVEHGDKAKDVPSCVSCHGAAMTGVEPAVPGLLGLPRDYLVAQFGAWRTQVRRAAPPDCMAKVAARLRPEDIAVVADWLAAQPLPANPAPAARSAQVMPLNCGSTKP